jgi:hypothetical protein
MMTNKTAAEIKAQVAQMLKELPDGWLERKMAAARHDPKRDVKTLEMICAALEDQVKKQRPKKRSPRKRGTRVS